MSSFSPQKTSLATGLYIVSTPLGNLDDISLRALKVLVSCDVIAAEDTRRTKILLAHYGISHKRIYSYHNHCEIIKSKTLIQSILEQEISIALVSDAGTPCISDPGFHLINEAYEREVSVIPVPGACSLITLLSVSGFNLQGFSYLGFLPEKDLALKETFISIMHTKSPVVFFDSPKRIFKSIAVLCEILGDWDLCLGREMTKIHEQIVRGSADKIHKLFLSNKIPQKGEFVIVANKKRNNNLLVSASDLEDLNQNIRELVSKNMSNKSILENIYIPSGLKKKDIYNKLIELKKET